MRIQHQLIDVTQTIEVLWHQKGLGVGAYLINQILPHEWGRHAELVFTALIVYANLFQLVGICYAKSQIVRR
jgi:hypothetical protein